ncbi:hypothetical protein G9G39_06135 [Cronobacter sp. EKM101R]|uniref:hypothetical protein n=1 Tax=unclassified Cronobacter TaxID=2649764 RepID=UPI001626B25B|nr:MULTISPECIES: hypothetical protein [unclassified Cronobacter]KAF6596641.1 hypothetical protein G9G39_06135 [Cronobacter sp. EKM101R]KAF6599467.1 hypothetical protein G9G38_05770 [Cronobacter sp. EKM102R]
MTVSTEVDHNDYTGNGVTTAFDYNFRIFKKSDLTVTVVDLNENITTLALDTDYTVTGAGTYFGGKVNLATPLQNGWKISIERSLPVTQDTDLRNQGSFFPEIHEAAFDKLTMLIQQAFNAFRLSLRKPSSVANWYDALSNYIRNIKDPRDPQDAATKNYVDTLSAGNFNRTLRVPDSFVSQLPPISDLEGKVIGFVGGQPVGLVPSSGSATDVLIELAKQGGDKRLGSSYGGTVYTDYQPAQLRKKYQFGIPGSVNSQREAVFYPAENLWYISKSTAFPATIPSSPDSNWRCVGMLNGYPIYDVRNWGLVGDDSTDNTVNFIRMLNKINTDYVTIDFPAGIFRYTDLGKITKNRITLAGKGSMQTVLKCTNTTDDHIALDIDAWPDPVNPNQPYLDAVNLVGLHVEGNANSAIAISTQGIARSIWSDVTAWGAKSTGTVIVHKSLQLSTMYNVMASKYRNLAGLTTNVAQLGMLLTVGTRAGAGQGSPSNNTFINFYAEGLTRGLNMTWGDQNTFINGSCEANTDYGLNINSNCRYNTFIGMGNENLNASTGDFVDRGRYTKFLNCYSSQRFVAQGFNGLIDGGYFELIEVQSVAIGYEVKNVAVKNWNTGSGGFTDSGSGTRKRSIYDIKLSSFVNTTDVRTAVTMSLTSVSGGTRGTWVNDTRLPCTVYVQGTASITQATVSRDGDAVSIPTLSVQAVRLEAGDTLSLTWSSTGPGPTISRRAHTEG